MSKLKDKLDQFHYHEMLDRLHVVMSMIDDHILQHPVAKVDKKLNSHLNKALEELWEAYQVAGNISEEDKQ